MDVNADRLENPSQIKLYANAPDSHQDAEAVWTHWR